MSSADRPSRNPPAGDADAPVPVMRGPQEMQHVQERFARVVDPSRAPTAVDPPAAHRPKTAWRPAPVLAPTLWLASSVFAVAAAGLFVLPELRSRLTPAPPPAVYSPTPPPPPAPALNLDTTEESTPFEGYVLVADSEPTGATVRLNGKDQGEVPVSVGVECSPGAPVLLEFVLEGFESARHRTTCKQDAMVKVFARLRKQR